MSAPATVAAPDHLRSPLWVMTLTWIVGMITVFPIANDALEAVSVFTLNRLAYIPVAVLFGLIVLRQPVIWRGWGRVESMMGLYLAVVLASWATTLPHKVGVDVKRDVNLLISSFVMPYTAFLIARHAGWSRTQVRTAYAVCVVAIGTYLIVVGLIQGLIDWRFLVDQGHQDVHSTRARGSFPNAIPYAAILSILLPVVLGLRALEPRPSRRLGFAVLTVALIEGLVLAQTRVTWIAVPLALLYFAALSVPARKSAIVCAVALLGAVTLSTIGVDARLIARPGSAVLYNKGSTSERISDAESVYNRVAVYGTALNMIAHRPVFGFGFGARTFLDARDPYYASCCGVSPEWAVPCSVPHNEVLNVLVLLGAVGLVVYLALWVVLWRLLSTATYTPDAADGTYACAMSAVFIILALTFQMHDLTYMSEVLVLFFFFVGLALPASAHTRGIPTPFGSPLVP